MTKRITHRYVLRYFTYKLEGTTAIRNCIEVDIRTVFLQDNFKP